MMKNLFLILFSLTFFLSNTTLVLAQSLNLNSLPGTKSVYIKSSDGKVEALNENNKVPAYSTIKLWVAAAVLQASEQGSLDLNESYTVTKDDKVQGTGIINPGESYTLGQLLELMLTHSDNTATNILIDKVGKLQGVNNFIKASNFPNTQLNRYIGKAGNQTDNLTSAKDGVTFMEKLLEKQIVSQSASDKLIEILKKRTQLKDTDNLYIASSLPPESDFIGKSGVGLDVKNDIGTFLDKDKKRIFLAILLSGLSNNNAGVSDISNLSKQLYDGSVSTTNNQTTSSSNTTTQSTTSGSGSTFKSNAIITQVGNPTDPKPVIGTTPGSTATAPDVDPLNLKQAIKNDFGLNMTGNWPTKYLQWIYEDYFKLKQTNPQFINLISGEQVEQCNCSLPNQLSGYVKMSIVGFYENDRNRFISTLTHELGHAIYHHKAATQNLKITIDNTFSRFKGGFSSYSNSDPTENYAEVVAYCLHGQMVGQVFYPERWNNGFREIASQFLGACRR